MNTLGRFKIKNPWLLTGVIAVGLFFVISLIYYVLFILPLANSKNSLVEAKNLAIKMKLLNSENTLASQTLVGLNPTHPSYENMVSEALGNVEKSDKEASNVSKAFKNAKFTGTKDTRMYLDNEFKDSFNSILDTYNNGKELKDMESFRKNYLILVKGATYNPHTDLGTLNLDSDSEREAALQRANNALSGMKKIYSEIQSVKHDKKETLKANIGVSTGILTEFIKELEISNVSGAIEKREAFLNSYRDVSENSTLIIRGHLQSANFSKSIQDQEKINNELDSLIKRIEVLEKNLPSDPLSRAKTK